MYLYHIVHWIAVYCNMWPMSTGQLGILLSLHCAQFLNVFTSFDYKSKQHHCGRWWKSRSSIREKCGGGKGESVQAGLEKCWASVGWRRPVWPNIALLCATVCPRPVPGSVQHTLFYQRGSVAVWQCGSVVVWKRGPSCVGCGRNLTDGDIRPQGWIGHWQPQTKSRGRAKV